MDGRKTIPEFFKGRSVFITGGTGFLGKILVEKVLRSCPDVNKVYLLMRPKKGKTSEERLKDIFDLPIFDKLKTERPGFVHEQVELVEGDVTQIGLGLNENDRQKLVDNVSLVFHVAASVRFDDPLKDAIIMNVRGTREVLKLVLEMSELAAYVHVSTTYCNTDRKTIDEKLYPAHADWSKSIELAERADDFELKVLTAKYMDGLPNTYTFTKSLAEHVVYDLCQKGKVPAVVFRPSIVISSMKEPVPGWIDNFNGPVGLMAVCGKGIMRSIYAKNDVIADYMPVDVAIKGLLIAAWKKGTSIDQTFNDGDDHEKVSFYNCSSYGVRSVTMAQLTGMARQLNWDIPLTRTLWYPGGNVTTCKYYHYVKVILQHLLPALLVDCALRIINKKPLLVKIQRKVYIANMAVEYFLRNQWNFLNKNFLNLDAVLPPEDRNDFGYNIDTVNVFEYFRNAMLGGREYLMKEDISTIEQAKTNMLRMYLLHQTVVGLFYCFVGWVLVFKMDMLNFVHDKLTHMYTDVFSEN